MKHILTHIIIVFLLLTASFGTSSAQQTWKNARHSVVAGVGGNIFMGDLGGGDENGGHFFNFKDMDPGILKLSTMAGYRYRLADRLSGKFTFTFSKVAADDVNANNTARRSRNLNFKSNLLEFGIGGEYYFLREKDMSRFSGGKGLFWKKWAGYISVELALLHFNPKGKYEGQWYELQPLCTEGQGTGVEFLARDGVNEYVVSANDPYKLTVVSIPVGLGFKYQVTSDISFGVEFLQHFTTTDYIDDCSSYYFNYDQQGVTPPSEMTKIFADRRSGGIASLATGGKRGNSGYNDTYFTAIFTLHYRFLK
ncbi:MAG: hypothetical protein II480_14155 [Bacteroidales bacterium]|nr:hypothetical protein [Bacteroidales bacterium]